ncbi:MAG: ImmA/IrrE family metallo-endopeptidase [Clostridium sp.]
MLHLNTRLDYEMTKYILAHELGHAILYANLSIMLFIENKNLIKSRYENEADKFAAELLLLDKVAFSEINIEQIAKTLYIPKKLIRLKYNLEIIE